MESRSLVTIGALFVAAACASGRAPERAGQDEPERMMAAVPARLPQADSGNVIHLLNRLTFGPRPGDIAQVQALGISGWLDRQLAPERIADPVQDEVRRTWAVAFLPPDELYRRYPPPNLANRGTVAPRDRDMPPAGRPDTMAVQRFAMQGRQLGGAVALATLERHARSERQLHEVMTDFWTNHFNVFMGKQAVRWLAADYVERAIRPNALGRFEDLLVAVATHPAMLVYLDNFQSVAPGSRPPMPARRALRRMPEQVQQRMPTGINENYARELLELHTLGVDGGYTQADVQNVARMLTGWGVRRPMQGDLSFAFNEWAHDRGEKTVLGERFPAGGDMDEGRRLLTMLARHPATAHHIAQKLCARLVADVPPDGCVDAAAGAFRRSDGHIPTVLRAIIAGEDFWSPVNRAAKIRSPLEFVAGALRVTGARPDSSPRLAGLLQQLGQPLFGQQVPTGWPETQEDWVNAGALLTRMNVAVAIASGRQPGLSLDLDAAVPLTGDRDEMVRRVNAAVLLGRGSANTLRVIREQIDTEQNARAARALAVGLALGSPEFQRQ